MIELALPAGSLETALTAFRHGADAVYFGLKDFSARKGAVNFSFEDLSKIRRFSLENGKKTYITINTLLDDSSIDRVISTLDEVAFYGTDGIIVQDLGVADIIRRYYPSLPLHGSTQLAVHTTEGVRVLEDLGFERVVLSRELNLKEIERIRKDCPDVELKAFIHGALCYGFSGLCSASAIKCSRSANKGECAQICRSWFIDEEDGEKGYFFSMEDMKAGERVLELERIGIDSLKVEGRLKSPEYCAAVAEYYRSILDRKKATREEEERVATTFLRKSGDGYLSYAPERPSLLSEGYPGHLGLKLGEIIREEGPYRTLRTDSKIENHDGLMYFIPGSQGLLEGKKFSAQNVSRTKEGYKVRIDERSSLLGKSLYKISDSTRREKTQNTNIPLFRKPIDIFFRVKDGLVSAEALGKRMEEVMEISQSKSDIDINESIFRLFSASGTSKYTLGNLTVKNSSSFPSPFLPPSRMKEFRRSFYRMLDEIETEPTKVEKDWKEEKESLVLPDRNLLRGDLPWSLEPKEIDGRTYITLPPVTFREREVWNEALEKVKGLKNVTIGLNNISQVNFAKEHPEYSYFADIFLYASNSFAASLMERIIPSFIGGYLWFERKEYTSPWPWKPTVTDFEPPFFISRTCFRHDAMGKSCKECTRNADFHISQFPDTFTVKVRNCMTIVERNR